MHSAFSGYSAKIYTLQHRRYIGKEQIYAPHCLSGRYGAGHGNTIRHPNLTIRPRYNTGTDFYVILEGT